MQFPWIAVSVGLLILVLLVLVLAFKRKKKVPPDYYTFYIMGLIWVIIGLPTGNIPLAAMGFIFMLTGLIHKDQWKKNKRKFSDMSRKEQKMMLILIGVLTLLVVAGLAAYLLAAKGLF